MCALKLEPYSAELEIRTSAPGSSDMWSDILTRYMEELARRCDVAGPCVIGHIKGLALSKDNGYLRISVISSSHPPETEGSLSRPVDELKFTLNIIVYGLSRECLDQVARESAHKIRSSEIISIIVQPLSHHHK